jgi:uncharacterized membrane protein
MLGLITGNKLITYIFIGVFLCGSVGGLYIFWKRDIERQALLEFNQKQMEQNLKDQQLFLEKQELISKAQQEATQDLIEQNQKISRNLGSVSTYLNSSDAKSVDRQASDILKKTIEQLANSGNFK